MLSQLFVLWNLLQTRANAFTIVRPKNPLPSGVLGEATGAGVLEEADPTVVEESAGVAVDDGVLGRDDDGSRAGRSSNERRLAQQPLPVVWLDGEDFVVLEVGIAAMVLSEG